MAAQVGVGNPAAPLAERRLGSVATACSFLTGYLQPGVSEASAAAQADAIWTAAVRRSADHRSGAAAESRAVLAVADRRPALRAADGDRAGRDGAAGAADRLREHRGTRAGARRLAPRRDRRAPRSGRDAGAAGSPADRREHRAGGARCGPRHAARAIAASRSSSATPSGSPRRSACSSTSKSTVS